VPLCFLFEHASLRDTAKHAAGQPSWWALLTAGGIGGIAFWTANYPLDLSASSSFCPSHPRHQPLTVSPAWSLRDSVKTQMQTQRGHGAESSLAATVKNIYQAKGTRCLLHG
jgi:hypothetical protein